MRSSLHFCHCLRRRRRRRYPMGGGCLSLKKPLPDQIPAIRFFCKQPANHFPITIQIHLISFDAIVLHTINPHPPFGFQLKTTPFPSGGKKAGSMTFPNAITLPPVLSERQCTTSPGLRFIYQSAAWSFVRIGPPQGNRESGRVDIL